MSGVCCYGMNNPLALGGECWFLAVQTLESFAVNLFCLPFLKVLFSVQFLLKLSPYIQEYPHFDFQLGLFVYSLICIDWQWCIWKWSAKDFWPNQVRGEESIFLNKIKVLFLSTTICSFTTASIMLEVEAVFNLYVFAYVLWQLSRVCRQN